MGLNVKEKLQNGQVTFGSWLQIPHPASAEILAYAGFDWICIDTEHAPIDADRMTDIIRAIENGGSASIVRVPWNDEIWIKRVLDAGARGVIVPMVMNAGEATIAASRCRYPRRSFGYCRANKYGENFDKYKNEFDPIVVIQIEHIEAIETLDDILRPLGGSIDATFIGPYDLSGSMGREGDFEHPSYKYAISKYEILSKKYDITPGVHIVRPDANNINSHIERGYKFIALGLDNVFMLERAKEICKLSIYKEN